MRRRKRFDGLDVLVAERGGALLATAVLLTGSRVAGGGYHFEVTVKDPRNQIAADSFTGDVTLGADNRIATVTYDRAARSNIKGENFTYHLHVVIELSDYGMPVKVETPAGALVRSK